MCKKQQLRVPANEKELRELQDEFYRISKEGFMKNELVGFENLKEIAFCEANIITAIHKLKANKGSQTPGIDEEVIRTDILEQRYDVVIKRIQEVVEYYSPKSIRRVYIPKASNTELRPIGINSIIDRIIQECIRNVIEPILEAQFFDHSYGFRPLREAHHAYERIGKIIHNTGYHWVIEGDISQFFDSINHNILLGALYHMGIRDRRILQMIKTMLKTGIMNEVHHNDIGTPQGSIISPILANVYLNKFDYFITREWEEKKLKNVSRYRQNGKQKGQKATTTRSIMKRKAPDMKPAYLIRYADDWVVITSSLGNAKKLKGRIDNYLNTRLKLHLSDKKTKITNVKKKSIRFLGFEIRARAGKSRKGLIIHGKPDREKLAKKVAELKKNIHEFKKSGNMDKLIHQINLYNSKVQGILNYYKVTTHVNIVLQKAGYDLNGIALKALRRKGKAQWIPAEEVQNLKQIHSGYKKVIAAVRYKNFWVGVTSLIFGKWKIAEHKNPKETIYSLEGREIYRKRTGKRRGLHRRDLTLSEDYSRLIYQKKTSNPKIYNFEFFMNRGYAYNIDKGKCRICCNVFEEYDEIETHHICTTLPVEEINRVKNLATLHMKCHSMIHSLKNLSNELSKKVWNKVLTFRNKLEGQKL